MHHVVLQSFILHFRFNKYAGLIQITLLKHCTMPCIDFTTQLRVKVTFCVRKMHSLWVQTLTLTAVHFAQRLRTIQTFYRTVIFSVVYPSVQCTSFSLLCC